MTTKTSSLKEQLLNDFKKISALEIQPSKVAGGHALFIGKKEIAHFHGANELDLRLTKKIIKQEGLTHPRGSKTHPGRKNGSEWIELHFTRKIHLKEILRLTVLAINQY